jgi:hypothetical protein
MDMWYRQPLPHLLFSGGKVHGVDEESTTAISENRWYWVVVGAKVSGGAQAQRASMRMVEAT